MLSWTEHHLPCLSEVAHPVDIARFAQQLSFQATLDEDPEAARAWAQLAMYAAPKTPLPDWMPASHTGRVALSAVDAPNIIHLDDDVGLVPPRGGGVFLNGHLLLQPVAAAEVNHLLQVADRRGRIVDSQWQHGPTFREGLLAAGAPDPEAPRWYVPPTQRSQDDFVQVRAVGDKRRKRMKLAAALGGATAGLYGVSWASRAAYNQSYSGGLYTLTNGTVVATGAAGAAAVGALTAALLTPADR